MKTRRAFLASLPLVGLLLGTRAQAAQPPSRGIPRALVDRYRIAPAGKAINADNVGVRGEDGRFYRLSQVLDALFDLTRKYW